MYTRSTLFYPLILAAFLVVITFWISLTVQQQGPKNDGSNRHDPDYTMHNFFTTQTDIAGNLRYVLAATEMVHYPDDDSTVLQRPRFTHYTANKPFTQILGLRAYVANDGEAIELVDDVKVVRQAYGGKGEMQVLTDKLLILPNQDIVRTDSPVVITQEPKTVISATGMEYDKNKQTLKLFKRVKVHYERPPLIIKKIGAANKTRAKNLSSGTLTKNMTKQLNLKK